MKNFTSKKVVFLFSLIMIFCFTAQIFSFGVARSKGVKEKNAHVESIGLRFENKSLPVPLDKKKANSIDLQKKKGYIVALVRMVNDKTQTITKGTVKATIIFTQKGKQAETQDLVQEIKLNNKKYRAQFIVKTPTIYGKCRFSVKGFDSLVYKYDLSANTITSQIISFNTLARGELLK